MIRHLWLGVVLCTCSLALGADVPQLRVAALGELTLESGETLDRVKLGYRQAGRLNDDRSNAILFPTWFTGTSEDLFTSGVIDAIDTDRFFVIAVDAFGNGISSSPSNHPDFPLVTIGDMVEAQHRLATEVLGIDHLYAVVGISMGGMQTFEWITRFPKFMDRAVPIVGSPRLGSYDVLLWETQIEAIDLARKSGDVDQAAELVGMIHALALQTPDYHARRTPSSRAPKFVEAAKRASSQRVEDRESQLRAMLAHDVSRRFDGSMERAAAVVEARVLNVVGLEDHMVTPAPALHFAALLGAESLELENNCGHLAFRCDQESFVKAVRTFLMPADTR
jgi:homoserine O-acetyltransferase